MKGNGFNILDNNDNIKIFKPRTAKRNTKKNNDNLNPKLIENDNEGKFEIFETNSSKNKNFEKALELYL